MVEEAARRGLSAVSIVDHDVTAGLEEAQQAGERAGVEVVPGIEMTAAWGEGARAVHVLGYFIDVHDAALTRALGRARSLMADHVAHVLEAVREAGGALEAGHLERYRHRYAGGAALVFGMLEQGVLRGAPAGTGMRLLRMAAAEPRAYTVPEAVALIQGAGGVAVLAHPARLRRGAPLLSVEDLAPLAATGLDGIEAWQWIPDGWGSDHYRAVAERMHLLASGGSDDHGKRLPDGRMRMAGQQIPASVLDGLRERARAPRSRPG